MIDAQDEVAAAVTERGYRAGWTAGQFAARQIAKLQEELGELAELTATDAFYLKPWWLPHVREAARKCKWAFDSAEHWWKHAIIADVERAKEELADLQVVIFCLADALGEISGEPYDVVQAAVEKAQEDVERGVRQESHASGQG